MSEELKNKILSETPEERKAKSEELAQKLKAAGVDVGEVLMRFRLEDPELVKKIYGDVLEEEEKEEFEPASLRKIFAKEETSIGDVIGYMMVYDWWEERKNRKYRNPTQDHNPEVEELKRQMAALREDLSKLIQRDEKRLQEEEQKKLIQPVMEEVTRLRASLEDVRRQLTRPPQPEGESQAAKELREKLAETFKKVESLEEALRAKELEGLKTDILNKTKADLDGIREQLLRMQGRLEESSSSKGITDAKLLRELKVLSGIDNKLDILIQKLPNATELGELVRQTQPPIVRTAPPRSPEEKTRRYQEAIKQMEEQHKKPTKEAKPPEAKT